MAKGKVKRHKQPEDHFLVVNTPWGSQSSLDYNRGTANNVEGWFRIMMRDLLDLEDDLYICSVFTVTTEGYIIVEVPKEADINLLLGEHSWSQFLVGKYAAMNANKTSTIYEYDYMKYGPPNYRGWNQWTPDCREIPSNFPIKSPYPPPTLHSSLSIPRNLPVKRLPVSGVSQAPEPSVPTRSDIASSSDAPGQPDRRVKVEQQESIPGSSSDRVISGTPAASDPRLRNRPAPVKKEETEESSLLRSNMSDRDPRIKSEPRDEALDLPLERENTWVKTEPRTSIKTEDINTELSDALVNHNATSRQVSVKIEPGVAVKTEEIERRLTSDPRRAGSGSQSKRKEMEVTDNTERLPKRMKREPDY